MTTEPSEVNKHNMLLWYRGLKSGQYEQTTNRLAQVVGDKVSYCCLGVACEVAIANGLQLDKKISGEAIFYSDRDQWTGGGLPWEVQQWLGVEETAPVIAPDYAPDLIDPCVLDGCKCTAVSAARANDSLGWTFDQIADAIYEFYGLAEVDPEAARG